jgi:hypothetical protein
MHYFAPLISEACQEHRRRRVRLLIAAAASVLGAAVIWGATGGLRTGAGGGAPTGSLVVRPSAVLARSLFMGVAVCHPSSSSCYRVGLAVWLKHPGRSVIATSAGVSASLNEADRSGIQMVSFGRRRDFIGFFQPAGIVPRSYLRTPDATPGVPIVLVSLRIVTSRGQTLVTRVRVPVQAGWG